MGQRWMISWKDVEECQRIRCFGQIIYGNRGPPIRLGVSLFNSVADCVANGKECIIISLYFLSDTRSVSIPLAVLWSCSPKVSTLSGCLNNLRRFLMEEPQVKLSRDGSAVLLLEKGILKLLAN